MQNLKPLGINFKASPFPWNYFQLKDQKSVWFAGLYDIWQDRNTNNSIISYNIITTIPNSLVGKIHHRMPVILHKEDEDVWLNPDIVEPEHVLPLLKPYPAEDMKEWEVSGEARNPRNDNPTAIKPIQ